jgi:hypothetical protein
MNFRLACPSKSEARSMKTRLPPTLPRRSCSDEAFLYSGYLEQARHEPLPHRILAGPLDVTGIDLAFAVAIAEEAW